MYKRYFLFIVLATLVITACKKKELKFTIEGVLTDATYNKPLVGAIVQIYKQDINSYTFDLISSCTVGSDGKYSFEVNRGKVLKYKIVVNKTNYFEISNEVSFDKLTTTATNTFNYSTTAKAWIKVHITHSSNNTTDVTEITKQAGKIDCLGCCSNEAFDINGNVIDTSYFCITDASTKYSIAYELKGTNNFGIKEVNSVAFDTVELKINY